jgi:thioredoxin reductase
MARALTAWSRDVVLCTDGPARLARADREALAANGLRIIQTRVARLDHADGQLGAICFADGTRLPRRALFFDLPAHGQSPLADRLGCERARDGALRCGRYESTTVPGVFAAGNILRDVQLSIVAAGQGASAAFGINRALTREDFDRRATGRSGIEHAGPDA